jgi:hypothetical protein
LHVRGLLTAPALGILVLGACSQLDPVTGPAVVACSDVDSDPAHPVSFANDIRPLMDRLPSPTGHGCKVCHYSTESSHPCLDVSGLDVATLGALRQGGITTSANIIIPGKPCESALVQKLLGDYYAGLRMPKDGPPFWTQDEIQLVIDWIAEGAQGGDNE